jgi:hypothetical protein
VSAIKSTASKIRHFFHFRRRDVIQQRSALAKRASSASLIAGLAGSFKMNLGIGMDLHGQVTIASGQKVLFSQGIPVLSIPKVGAACICFSDIFGRTHCALP